MEPEQGEALIDDGSGSFRRYSIPGMAISVPATAPAHIGLLLMILPKSGSNYYVTVGNLAQPKSFPQKEQRAALRIFNVPYLNPELPGS